MAISLHGCGLLMLDVCSRAPQTNRRVAFFWSLFVLLPALASAQTPTVTAMWDPTPSNAKISSYEVCIGTSSLACDSNLVTVSASQTSYTFAPTPGQLVYVAVRALNQKGRGHFSNEQSFSIPFFAALANRSTALNVAIAPINLSVSDPDGSPLTFTHTGLPIGVRMNASTGQITGTPTNAGRYNVTIFVSDGLKTVSRSFVWTVAAGASADRTPPALTVISHASGLVVTSASQTIRGTATDNGRGGSGVAAVRVNGRAATGATASGNNTASWSQAITLSTGSNTITIDAADGAGNIQMQQITLQLGKSGSSNNGNGGGGSTSGGDGSTGGSGGTSSGPLAITAFTSSLTSPQAAGRLITFTAAAKGGQAPYQFKWLIKVGNTWTVLRNWSSSNTYAWIPKEVGGYSIGIWVRDATTTADVGNVSTSIPFRVRKAGAGASTPPASAPSAPVATPTPTAPLTLTGLTSNLPSPQATSTRITFTASATGGNGQYQFKWLIYQGKTWTVVRDWNSSTTFVWNPRTFGPYRIGIWVRDSTTTADVSTVSTSIAYRIKKAGD